MKSIKFIIFIVLLNLVSFNIISQGLYVQTIRGRVIDAKTEMPLPGATVVLLHSEPLKGTLTDTEGFFRIDEVPLGRQSIQVSFIGYAPVTLNNLSLSSGKETVVEIKLEELVFQSETVVIKARTEKNKAQNEMATVSARSFSIEETERYAGSLGDPSRMASNFAGVSSPSDQRNDIIIRGNSPMGLLWRLEGIDIPNPNHFGSIGSTGGPVSMLNNNVLTNSDFFTGAFPAEFGNALAGAFDLKLRNGNNEKHEFLGQIGFNGFELGAEGPLSKNSRASYLFNFRYSTLEIMKTLGMDFGTGQAIPQYKDMNFKINLPTQKYGRFTLFGVGGISYIEMLDSRGDSSSYGFSSADIYYGSDMGVAGLTHTLFMGSNTRLHTTASVTGVRNYTDFYRLSYNLDKPIFDEKYNEIKYNFSSKVNKKFSAKNNVNFGISYDIFDLNYKGKHFDTIFNAYFYHISTQGNMAQLKAFGEWQHKFTDKIILNSGIFSHVLLLNNSYAVEPRIGLKKILNNKHSVGLALGMHSQMQPRFIYFSSSLTDTLNDIYTKTNADLDYSRALHLVAAYDFLINDGLRLKIESYYQYLYNIPVAHQRPEFSIINQGSDFTFQAYNHMVNKGKGTNYGLEITLEKFLNKGFYYLFTASLFKSTYEGYDKVVRPSAFNNKYVFNALAGYEINISQRNVLAFDIKSVLAGGRPYVPINETASLAAGNAVYDWANIYQLHHNNYFRLNARITFRLNGKKVNQEWGLDLQNLTNHKNVFSVSWDEVNNRTKTDYQQGFMPMMTYKILF